MENYYCSICNKKYASYQSIWNHNKKFHRDKDLSNTNNSPYNVNNLPLNVNNLPSNVNNLPSNVNNLPSNVIIIKNIIKVFY